MGLIARIKGEEPGIIKKIPHAFQSKGHYGEYLTEYALEHGNIGNVVVEQTKKQRIHRHNSETSSTNYGKKPRLNARSISTASLFRI